MPRRYEVAPELDAVRCVWYICNSNAFSFLLNLYETDVLLSCLAWAQTEREEEMQNHVSIGLIKLCRKVFDAVVCSRFKVTSAS